MQREFGSRFYIKSLGKDNIKFYDSENNLILPKCKCGKDADAAVISQTKQLWLCYDCAFGNKDE